MWEFTDRNRVGLINNYFLLAFLFNLVPYHHCLPLFFHPIIGNYPHTHTSSLSANYSFSHSLFLLSVPLPFVFVFFSFSLPHWLSFTRCPLPRTDQSILQQSVRAFLRGGREDCSGWAFLLFLRWQRHRGAIDSSTELHSLLMLECLMLWRFSQTEIDRAELCTVHLNLQLFKIFFFPRQVVSEQVLFQCLYEKTWWGSCMRQTLKPVGHLGGVAEWFVLMQRTVLIQQLFCMTCSCMAMGAEWTWQPSLLHLVK